MKEILFITTQLPWPPLSGGVIKSFRLLQYLSRQYRVHLIAAYKNADEKKEADLLSQLPELASAFGIHMDIGRSPLNLIKSYLHGGSLNIFRNWHPELKKRISQKVKTADLIFVDHYEMYPYILEETSTPVILHTHNAEFVMWERLAALEQNPLRRFMISMEAGRIKRAEKKFCDHASLVFAAPNDREALVKLGVPEEKFRITYHLGEDEMLDLPVANFSEREERLLFVGTLSWEANVDGLLWFLEKCWPLLSDRHPGLTFSVTGKNPDSRIAEAAGKYANVILTGFVEDLEPLYQSTKAFLVPLRFGSGIKVKLLNSMYRGLPAVATSIGTEGLSLQNEQHVLEADDPEAFAGYVSLLLENEEKWNLISQESRKLAREKYSWKPLLEAFGREVESLL